MQIEYLKKCTYASSSPSFLATIRDFKCAASICPSSIVNSANASSTSVSVNLSPSTSWASLSSTCATWSSSMSTSISAWSSSQTASCLSMAPSEPRPALPGILRSVGRAQTNSPDPRAPGSGLGTSTHVTFSEELSHPIPSVSPAKELSNTNEKKSSNGLSPPSESNEIFSDLESVLSEAADFSFHSALASAHTGADRLTVKTPEKLLTSVPPAVIMEQKKSQLPFPPSCSSSSSTSPPSSSPFPPPPSPPSSAFPSPSPTSFPSSALPDCRFTSSSQDLR